MISIELNGEIKQVEENLSLLDLLEMNKMNLSFAAIAVNREFIPRGLYSETKVKANDQIECVIPMQGG